MRVARTVLDWKTVLLVQLLFPILLSAAFEYKPEPLPLLLPSDVTSGRSSTGSNLPAGKLELVPQGIDYLASLGGCVAPVVVIGPYRSGKSFTLNQLLKVDCEHGFGVGHTRNTQTRGIWIWGQPQPVTLKDGSTCQVVYLDTEGFESTGRGNAYDDRIFTLSTLLSSLLIYNLPEAIRESDISKLSFAVQLAEGLFSRGTDDATHSQQQNADSAQDPDAPLSGSFEPGALLFLIQRDFLQGTGAQQAVEAALATVPNPENDPEVAALNRVRASLSRLAADSSGFSLPQPHLQRTQLCQLPDDQLDPGYRTARDGLRQFIKDHVRPKVVGGRKASGAALAALMKKLVEVLNQQEIPSVANLLDTFNKQLVYKAVSGYRQTLAGVKLPVDADMLTHIAEEAKANILKSLRHSLLGNRVASSGNDGNGNDPVLKELNEALEHELNVRLTENQATSDSVCGKAEATCEEELDRAVALRLPSMNLFTSMTQRCEARFNATCAGPAHDVFWQRLQRAEARSAAAFKNAYNDRLYNGLVILSVVGGCVFRWVLRTRILEAVCWLCCAWLQIAPHLSFGGSTILYESKWWQVTTHIWEGFILLFQPHIVWIWLLLIAAWSGWRWRARKQGTGKGKAPGLLSRAAGRWGWRRQPSRQPSKELDV